MLKQNQASETGRIWCLLMSLFRKKEGHFYLMVLSNAGFCYKHAFTRQVIPEPTSTPSVLQMDTCVSENLVLKQTSILPLTLKLSVGRDIHWAESHNQCWDQERTRLKSRANQTLDKLRRVPSKEQKKGNIDGRALE